MIIELKDLPLNRKISRILVDVQFEDSTEPKNSMEPNDSIAPVAPVAPVEVTESVAPVVPIIPDIPSKKEHKDIPPEMKDLEF